MRRTRCACCGHVRHAAVAPTPRLHVRCAAGHAMNERLGAAARRSCAPAALPISPAAAAAAACAACRAELPAVKAGRVVLVDGNQMFNRCVGACRACMCATQAAPPVPPPLRRLLAILSRPPRPSAAKATHSRWLLQARPPPGGRPQNSAAHLSPCSARLYSEPSAGRGPAWWTPSSSLSASCTPAPPPSPRTSPGSGGARRRPAGPPPRPPQLPRRELPRWPCLQWPPPLPRRELPGWWCLQAGTSWLLAGIERPASPAPF